MTKFVIFTICILLMFETFIIYKISKRLIAFETKNLTCTLQQGNQLHIFKCTKIGNLVEIKLN
jgi:hypothetical protein